MHVRENAVHTSASKEQTLTNIFGTVSLQAGKEKEGSSKAPQTTGHTAEIQRSRLGRSGFGRSDRRSHFLDRAEPVGGSAQR